MEIAVDNKQKISPLLASEYSIDLLQLIRRRCFDVVVASILASLISYTFYQDDCTA